MRINVSWTFLINSSTLFYIVLCFYIVFYPLCCFQTALLTATCNDCINFFILLTCSKMNYKIYKKTSFRKRFNATTWTVTYASHLYILYTYELALSNIPDYEYGRVASTIQINRLRINDPLYLSLNNNILSITWNKEDRTNLNNTNRSIFFRQCPAWSLMANFVFVELVVKYFEYHLRTLRFCYFFDR